MNNIPTSCKPIYSPFQEDIRSIYPTSNPQTIFEIIEGYIPENQMISDLFVNTIQLTLWDVVKVDPIIALSLKKYCTTTTVLDLSRYNFTIITGRSELVAENIFLSFIIRYTTKKYFPKLETIVLPSKENPFIIEYVEGISFQVYSKNWEELTKTLSVRLETVRSKVRLKMVNEFDFIGSFNEISHIVIKDNKYMDPTGLEKAQ